MWDLKSQQELDREEYERQKIKESVRGHNLLDKAIKLLKESYEYIDNTHGYDSPLFGDIREFLDKAKNV